MSKKTIGDVIRAALKEGKSTAEVLDLVKKEFPDAQTSSASVAWYRSKMKKEGTPPAPKAPAKKPNKKLFADTAVMIGKETTAKALQAAAQGPVYHVGKFKSTQGMEGPGFIVTLFRGPVPVARASDYGDGGMIHWEWFDNSRVTVKAVDYKNEPHEYKGTAEEALFWAHCLSLPKYANPVDRAGGMHHMTPDLLVEELVNDMMLEKQFLRLTKGKVAYITADGKLYTAKMAPCEDAYACVRRLNPGVTVLNGMSMPDAVALLKKYQR